MQFRSLEICINARQSQKSSTKFCQLAGACVCFSLFILAVLAGRMKKNWLWIALLVSGCHSGTEHRQVFTVDHHLNARSQEPRVKMVVLHYTAEDNARSLHLLSQGEVSAHYLITSPDGKPSPAVTVYQLVPESRVAWHAGVSGWRGYTHLNSISIGIELVNPGYYRKGDRTTCTLYPPAQIDALENLLQTVVKRYAITPVNIVGHSDVAPLRKQDPGPCFPWHLLAKAGLGAWPDAGAVAQFLAGHSARDPADPRELMTLLARYGYPVTDPGSPGEQAGVISAFQMHFRPARVTGKADAETEAIARALLQKYGTAH